MGVLSMNCCVYHHANYISHLSTLELYPYLTNFTPIIPTSMLSTRSDETLWILYKIEHVYSQRQKGEPKKFITKML